MAISHVTVRTLDRFRRQCKGKVRHDTEASALRHVDGLKKRSPESAFGHYECGFCGSYHVGHDRRTMAANASG